MKKASSAPSVKAARAMLEKHGRPVAFHEVRTRFLGNIATPALAASPLQIIKGLWGGELPVFDGIDEFTELLNALIHGLWNDLTRHQKRSQPFRLTRVPMDPTAANLAHFHRRAVQRRGGHRPARAGPRGCRASFRAARDDGRHLRAGVARSRG